jgi:hypothetical protein
MCLVLFVSIVLGWVFRSVNVFSDERRFVGLFAGCVELSESSGFDSKMVC